MGGEEETESEKKRGKYMDSYKERERQHQLDSGTFAVSRGFSCSQFAVVKQKLSLSGKEDIDDRTPSGFSS